MQTLSSPPTNRLPAAREGFSLVGMLVASSIAMGLATMAYEVGTEMIRSAKTSAAGSEVAATLHRARQLAMTEHTVHYVGFIRGADDRLDHIVIIRDDGSGAFEEANDEIVSTIRLDQDVRIGDGEGADHSMPVGTLDGEPIFGLGFGTRGQLRDPITGAPMNAFINISAGAPVRGSWRKFSNIQLTPSGSIGNLFHRIESTG